MTETTPERKPYSEPQLIAYGDIETLTQIGSGVNADVDGASGQT